MMITTERKLDVLAKKMLAVLNQRAATLDIFLLPHDEIKKIKARFIKKQTEPNVLAFPEPIAFPHPEMPKGKNAKRYLGEIYLNADILRESPGRAAPLLLHGVLHLLGYDHKKDSDAEKMEKLEKKVLRKM